MRYLMSERTAQFVRGLMQDAQTPKSVAAGPAKRIRSDAVVEDSFAHPFELRWAASAGEGGAGAWIIWLPEGALVRDGVSVDLTGELTAAANYPAGWWDISSVFADGDVPELFKLYLDLTGGTFGTGTEEMTSPVLIAEVADKLVKGVVESALVVSEAPPRPFDLQTLVEESGAETVTKRKIVRCTFRNMGTRVELEDYELPELTAADSVVVAWEVPADTVLTAENWNDFWSVKLDSEVAAEEGVSIIKIKLYDFDDAGNVLVDYRDADINNDVGFKDNNTIADNDPPNAGRFNMSLHLKGFYGTERDLSTAPAAFDVLVRTTPEGGDTPQLCYVPWDVLEDSGGGSSGDEEDEDVDPSTGSFAYDRKNQRILGGVVMVGRRAYYVAGMDATDGSYRVKITFNAMGGVSLVLELGDGFESPSGSTSYIPVMMLRGGKVTADYRGAFVVPAYD